MVNDQTVCGSGHRTSTKFSYFILLFFKIFIYFIYLFLAVLGLHCCTWAFPNCGEQGLLFIAVRGLLIAVASLVVKHGSRHAGFSSGLQAQ